MGERRRQHTSRLRLGIGLVLTPIHHPLHVAVRMATLDILSRGRVDVGIGCTGYPCMPGSASPAASLRPAGRTASARCGVGEASGGLHNPEGAFPTGLWHNSV